MFYFRINKIMILNNRDSKFIGIFGQDRAKVNFLSFITTGNEDLPNLEKLSDTNSSELEKQEIVKTAVSKVVASRVLPTIENVKDGQVITFGDTGYVLFSNEKIPDDFNWALIAIESDRDVRQLGQTLDGVIDGEDFSGFTTNLAKTVGAATNPAFAAGVAIVGFVLEVLAKNLKNNKDDQLGILYMSLNRREHYLHGIRNKDDVLDMTGNMYVDYSIFAHS